MTRIYPMGSSLLALLDDITAMTKVAAGKTAGVLGDDLEPSLIF